jgi:hypothetical protein
MMAVSSAKVETVGEGGDEVEQCEDEDALEDEQAEDDDEHEWELQGRVAQSQDDAEEQVDSHERCQHVGIPSKLKPSLSSPFSYSSCSSCSHLSSFTSRSAVACGGWIRSSSGITDVGEYVPVGRAALRTQRSVGLELEDVDGTQKL